MDSIGLNFSVKIPKDPNPRNEYIFLTSDKVEIERRNGSDLYNLGQAQLQSKCSKVGDFYEVQESNIVTFDTSVDGAVLKLSHIDPSGSEIILSMELLDDDTLVYQEAYRNQGAVIGKTRQVLTFVVSTNN